MVLKLLDEAVKAGARLKPACELLGISVRAVQRWKDMGVGEDQRHGPKKKPGNKLSEAEVRKALRAVNSPEFRDLSPKQIVALLADRGQYLASESTIYRILRRCKQMNHREPSRAATHRRPMEHLATGAWQVLSWDITYLPTPVLGKFYYLYMFMDVWSRKTLGWTVEETESAEIAASFFEEMCRGYRMDPCGVVLHADNGSAMKGFTMVMKLTALGVLPSFSRPHVSDDNPFSEALFRTMKYRPWYPRRPFPSLAEARSWVDSFVVWYNTRHLHSGIGYVTPDDRHFGRDLQILERRRRVYEKARHRHPERWTTKTRAWNRPDVVRLNPDVERQSDQVGVEVAA